MTIQPAPYDLVSKFHALGLPLEAAVAAGNALVHNPNIGKIIEDIMSDLKPEAAYFCLDDGQRTMYLDVEVDDVTKLPGMCEPLWLALKADIKWIPALRQEEFANARPGVEQAAQKYG